MKRLTQIFILVGLILVTGCGSSQSDGSMPDEHEDLNTFEGYVADLDENRVLVTENRLSKPFHEMKFETVNQEAGSAVYFNLDDVDDQMRESLMFGEKLKVKTGAIAESYPGQGKAFDIIREIDEPNDLLFIHGDYENIAYIHHLKDGKTLRIMAYTVEGDPTFEVIKPNEDHFNVYMDNTQDGFSSEKEVKSVTCQSIEESFQEQQVHINLTECSDESGMIPILSAPVDQVILPEQQYRQVTINIDGTTEYETTEQDQITDMINSIEQGKKTSVVAMTLPKPEGKITFHGELTNVTYDLYKDGSIIAHNVYIQSNIVVE
ncbi:DUF3221 domain-containing protein [Aquisalibacillus elongatus]|uniref:Uncharacterized protein DUF3221 n=1 Tax=Aquisalibacillus elongatus TaxID=485577 RepID=A0A3N5B416_9BACI|nr:DUF3221 domain-containing protein [Aquisalibacillus elongatus]RPF52144.1 uncharacterized protein DUF3221 [Aquisalibacillus elongatus]